MMWVHVIKGHTASLHKKTNTYIWMESFDYSIVEMQVTLLVFGITSTHPGQVK